MAAQAVSDSFSKWRRARGKLVDSHPYNYKYTLAHLKWTNSRRQGNQRWSNGLKHRERSSRWQIENQKLMFMSRSNLMKKISRFKPLDYFVKAKVALLQAWEGSSNSSIMLRMVMRIGWGLGRVLTNSKVVRVGLTMLAISQAPRILTKKRLMRMPGRSPEMHLLIQRAILIWCRIQLHGMCAEILLKSWRARRNEAPISYYRHLKTTLWWHRSSLHIPWRARSPSTRSPARGTGAPDVKMQTSKAHWKNLHQQPSDQGAIEIRRIRQPTPGCHSGRILVLISNIHR